MIHSIMSHSVLILGDAMIDEYLAASPVGISDEAPVAVLDWIRTRRTLGGMLNVAASLHALGMDVTAVALVGHDEAGQFAREECGRLGIRTQFFDDGRPTVLKTRVQSGADFLARIDTEQTHPMSRELRIQVQAFLAQAIPSASMVILSDYAKGFCTPELLGDLIQTSRRSGIALLVDGKPEMLAASRGAAWIKPNRYEALQLARRLNLSSLPEAPSVSQWRCFAAEASDALGLSVLLTLDADGMILHHEPTSRTHQISAALGSNSTFTGAGDVVLASLAHALLSGLTGDQLLPAIVETLRCARADGGTLTLSTENRESAQLPLRAP